MSDSAQVADANLIDVEVVRIGNAAMRGGTAVVNRSDGSPIDHSIDRIAASDIQRGIESICKAVGSALIATAPDSWTVELNLGFKAGAKVPVLMSGEANAALKVTMNWKKAPPALS